MRISVEELRAKAAKFNSSIRWRNVREYVAALIIIVWVGTGLWKVTDTRRAHCIRADTHGCDLLHLASLEMGFCDVVARGSGARGLRQVLSKRTRSATQSGGQHLEVGHPDRYSPDSLCSTPT